MKAVSVKTMRRMDETAIHTYGIPGIVLMEHAAMALCAYMKEHVSPTSAVLLLCGPGNNGGDGFALARLLVQEGFTDVQIFCCVDINDMTKEEAINARIAQNYAIPLHTNTDLDKIKPLLEHADVVIDALFGTGLSRDITGFYDQLILQLNLSQKHVISVDIASGIHGDTGAVMGCAVQATITLTFESYKLGMILYPGSAYCGQIVPLSIQMPPTILDEATGLVVLDDKVASALLPKRDAHSHKGSYGKALMIGGSQRMHGAVTMAAKAALRSGIGTLTLFVPGCISQILSNKLEESMLISASHEGGYFAMDAVLELKQVLAEYDVIIIGNGMGRNAVTRALVETVLTSDRDCILDGDALYEAGMLREHLQRSCQTMLTPHVKEMSYVSGHSVKEIQKDPIGILQEFLKAYPGVTIALKDAYTIIADAHAMYLNLAGNHALAKGGSGDVLCGILAGLYGQGRNAIQSAACAVYVHARCADLLMMEEDANSILPKDVIDTLSKVYHQLRHIT